MSPLRTFQRRGIASKLESRSQRPTGDTCLEDSSRTRNRSSWKSLPCLPLLLLTSNTDPVPPHKRKASPINISFGAITTRAAAAKEISKALNVSRLRRSVRPTSGYMKSCRSDGTARPRSTANHSFASGPGMFPSTSVHFSSILSASGDGKRRAFQQSSLSEPR